MKSDMIELQVILDMLSDPNPYELRYRWSEIHRVAGRYISRRIIAQEIADGEGIK